MNRTAGPLLSLLVGLAPSWVLAEEERLEPRVRVSERPWEFFQRIPCHRLDNVETQGKKEETLLERRRRECLRQYREFAPRSGVR